MTYREQIRVSAHIADIHLGVRAISGEDFKKQLYEVFLKPISELSILDLITVNGDVAHLALSFNSVLSEVYIWFFDQIVKIANQKDAAIIVIQGTLSHDCDQLANVKHYKNKAEIYFVEEPTVLEVKGMRIYGLPDIHVASKEEEQALYAYPDNYFDMVLFHGSVTETQFMAQESEHAITKNIIYNTKQLLRMTKGPILGGHIHTYMQIQERLYYISSFTRFAHGEEGDKGAMITAYLPETGQFVAERIINHLAPNFNLYQVKPQLFAKYDADELIKKINDFADKHNVHRLTLEFTYELTDANVAKLQILRTYFSRDKRVTNIKTKMLSKKELDIFEKTEKNIDESKKYLVDKGMTVPEKLQRFIMEEFKVDIPLTKVMTILTSDELLVPEGV